MSGLGSLGTAPRLGLFFLALLVAFGAAFGVGRAIGPLDDAGPDPAPVHDTHAPEHP